MAGTILYVDDSPELPSGTDAELRRLGYRLLQTPDPKEGLRLVREGVPRLVLLEVLLPDAAGWQLFEEIRGATDRTREVPVVVFTRGERTPELYARAVELGASDFLCKPVLRAQLLGAVLECGEQEASTSQVGPVETGAGDAVDDFSGDLAEASLPELLLRLRRIGASGVLLIQHEIETRGIHLRNGSPIAVASNRGAESLEDFLVRTKWISGDEHEVVTEVVRSGRASAREVLVRKKILSARDVDEAVRQRAAEPLLEGFGWSEGSYRFEPGKRLKSGQGLDLDQNAARLLAEGVRQWTPARVVRQMLDRRGAYYVSRADDPPLGLRELGANAIDADFLDGLNGECTVAEALGSCEERWLYALLVVGVIEVHASPVLELCDVLEVDAGVTRPSASSPPAEPDDEAAADSQALDRLEAAVESRRDADDRRAARTLSSEAEPPRVVEERATRSLDAESWFRKGEEALRRKIYPKAVEAFGMAAHLDPGQGEYAAHLGYALHLAQPRNELVRREALEHIANGIKRAPDRWKPLVFLGRVFKAAGDLDNARKMFRRALKVQPDCVAALHELKLLNAPRKPAGLLDRLRGGWASIRGRRS